MPSSFGDGGHILGRESMEFMAGQFYLVRDRNLKTLQLLLLEYLQSMDSTIISDINIAAQKANQTSSLSLKACISVLTMLPIMLVYPFMQRYFIKGIMIGSIKG